MRGPVSGLLMQRWYKDKLDDELAQAARERFLHDERGPNEGGAKTSERACCGGLRLRPVVGFLEAPPILVERLGREMQIHPNATGGGAGRICVGALLGDIPLQKFVQLQPIRTNRSCSLGRRHEDEVLDVRLSEGGPQTGGPGLKVRRPYG